MKTYNNLYELVYSSTNLFNAYVQCRRGKGDRDYVTRFEAHLQEHLDALAEALWSRGWTPAGYTSFYVSDPKRRLINAPAFEDRIIHRALYDVIALFALDDVTERLEGAITALSELNGTLKILQDYLEQLL